MRFGCPVTNVSGNYIRQTRAGLAELLADMIRKETRVGGRAVSEYLHVGTSQGGWRLSVARRSDSD